MARAKRHRIRRNVCLTKAADVALRTFAKENSRELSQVVSDAILFYVLVTEPQREAITRMLLNSKDHEKLLTTLGLRE